MSELCNILVLVDPTADKHPAVAKAAILAARFNARLELYACDTKASREARWAEHVGGGSTRPFTSDLNPMLDSLAMPLRARGLDVTTECECGDPLHTMLIDRIKRARADLVVKDTHHHALARRTFLTNTDWHLIRTCPAPLLLTKSKPWAATPKIMAAVDPGHANDKPAELDQCILKLSAILARQLQGELRVVHAYIPEVLLQAAVSPAGALPIADLRDEQESRLQTVVGLASDYCDRQNVHVETGAPAGVIVRIAAEQSCDVVAMGAVSRSGMSRIFIGSTAEGVLENLPCDALIVRRPDYAEALPF